MGPAAGVILASYAGCDQVLVVTLFTVGMAFMGFFYPSLKVNALDLAPNYAGTLMAIVNGIGAVSGIISPYLIGILVPNVSRIGISIDILVKLIRILFQILFILPRINFIPCAENFVH